MSRISWAVAAFVVSTMLTACGDSDSGSSTPVATSTVDPEPQVEGISFGGGGVKGPLAGAAVNVYAVDYDALDFRGTLLSSGATGTNARLTGVSIPNTTLGKLILEFNVDGDTVDITTNAAPAFDQLITAVDASRIINGDDIYASLMTTMATRLAMSNADNGAPYSGNGDGTITEAEFEAALTTAQSQVKSTLGFGLSSSVDIFTVPPLITDDTDTADEQTAVAAYRQANEAIAAMVTLVSDNSSAADNPQQIFDGLIDDLTDGDIDGTSTSGSVPALAALDVAIETTLTTTDPSTLVIPGTTTLVSDIEAVLVDETTVTESTTDTTDLENGTTNVVPAVPRTESDIDEDGVIDAEDAFPNDPTETVDSDSDGVGNNADSDDDNDGVDDASDAFPHDANEQLDTDGDGTGNNTDSDDDNDGAEDSVDAFPFDSNEQLDTDGDGTGNNADSDDDNDGVDDASDAFPQDAGEYLDTDGDAVGNNTDGDDDNDGIDDASDAFPLDDSESVDTDGDGIGNNADNDDDNDGIDDTSDAFPLDDSESLDTDGDGIGNNADGDDDNDGVDDASDAFPLDADEYRDTDGDGVGDNSDSDPYPVVSFTNEGPLYFAVNEFQTHAAQATPAQNFIYESSDESIATVENDGLVTALIPGTATITAYISGTPKELTSASYTVNVYEPCSACNTYRRIIDEADADEPIDMFKQSDGKVIILSRTLTKASNGETMLLTRLNPDGSLDNSFGTLGHMSMAVGGGYFISGLAVQSDGKILVLGDNSSGRTTFVTRFNTDGSLDTTFGTAGQYQYNDGIYWSSADIALDDSDNIVIALNDLFPDTSTSPTTYIQRSLFVRLSPDGVPETSFDSDGVLLLSDFYVYEVALLDNGKLLAAGISEDISGGHDISVARFNADGALDTTFGIGGQTLRNIGYGESVNQMLVLDDGDIVVVGTALQSGKAYAVLLRMKDTGAWYINYNGNGQVLIDFNGANSRAYAALAQEDGKIVVAGRTDAEIALARVNTDGSLDNSMPSVNSIADGIVTYDLDYEDSIANAVAVLRRDNGGYLLLGFAAVEQDYGGIYHYFNDTYLIGLDENGALDNSSFIATGLANEVVTDFDDDGIRDRIDSDDDQDGIYDEDDAMPFDTDNDGLTNDVDVDDDGDGINDADDTYPFDLDNDGYLNYIDPDDDGDGVNDDDDAFPYDSSEQLDTDEDGIGNNADPSPYPVLTFSLSGSQTVGVSSTLDNPATASVGSEAIQYTSSDTDIATVDAFGTVTPVTTGTVTISADLTDWPDTPVSYQLTVDNSCGTCTSSTVEIDAGDLEYTTGVIELSDGDLLTFGYVENANISSVVTRLKADGTAESNFNSGAVLQFAYSSGTDTKVIDAAEQSDGKILLLSEYTELSITDFMVTRLNADGSIDTSYGTSGHFFLHDPDGSFIPGSMAMLSDNRVIVAGTYQFGGTDEAIVIRLSTGGDLDAGFGFLGLGISTVSTDGLLFDVALDGNEILVVGTDGGRTNAVLTRLTSTGDLDTSFNGTGSNSISLLGEITRDNRVLVQSTGQYLISGSLEEGEFFIARFDTDGTLDTSFGSSGISREGVSSAPFSLINEAYALIETSDGYLMVVGGAEIGASSGILDSLALWRFDSSGVIDSVITEQFGFISPYLAGVAAINSSVGGMVIAVDNYRAGPSEVSDLMLYSVNDDGSEKSDRFE